MSVMAEHLPHGDVKEAAWLTCPEREARPGVRHSKVLLTMTMAQPTHGIGCIKQKP